MKNIIFIIALIIVIKKMRLKRHDEIVFDSTGLFLSTALRGYERHKEENKKKEAFLAKANKLVEEMIKDATVKIFSATPE